MNKDRLSPRWRKSSYSGNDGGACVEVSSLAPTVAVRDSKDSDGARLTFAAEEWRAFTEAVKRSDYDLR